MAQRFVLPFQSVYDLNGKSLAGAKLTFEVTGGGTPKDTFSDEALTVANTNPVVANNQGEFDDIFLESGDYRVTLTDKNDVTQPNYPADPVRALRPDLASITDATKGSFLVGVFLTISGYIGRKLSAWIADRPYYVKDFGATGDGSTDDTSAIDSAQSAVTANSDLIFNRTANSFKMGAVELDKALGLKGDGKITLDGANAGFECKANMSGHKLIGLEFVGEGVTTNSHRALWNDGSTYTFTKAIVAFNKISDMLQGLDLGDYTESVIAFNHVDNSVGTGAGQGYGIVAGQAKRCVFIGQILTNNKRHALYNNKGEFNLYLGNIYHDHRNGEAGGGSNAALAISRDFKGINIGPQVFAEGSGPAIRIDIDGTAITTGKACLVNGQVFYENDGADIQIGAGTPSATANVEGVKACNNVFYPVADRQNGFISCTSCLGLSLSHNHFWAPNGTVAGYIGIVLNSTGGDTYYDNISIQGNTGKIASSGGGTTLVNIGPELCVGTTRIDIFDNDCEVDTMIAYQTDPPTNPNIRTDWDKEYTHVLGTGSITVNVAGYNRFKLDGTAGAATITNFTNAYDGKVIELRFIDGNVTVDRSNAVLYGGSNFVSSNRDIIKLKWIASDSLWYQTDEAVIA